MKEEEEEEKKEERGGGEEEGKSSQWKKIFANHISDKRGEYPKIYF